MRKLIGKLISNQDLNRFLKKSMTLKEDIEKILKVLNIPANVVWQLDFDPKISFQIINMGNGLIGGTHWVAVDNVNKRYFDSFGMPPPTIIPADYEWIPIQIQNINYGHCGQYAVLFLWYSMRDEIDQFYNIFDSINID